MSFCRHLGLTLACTGILASGAASAQEAAKLSGHVDLVSRYILRGVSTTYGPSAPGAGNAGADAPESDKAALQLGADWSHPSGFYLGYFGSTINYSYKRLGQSYSDRSIADFQNDKSIENDLYGGYTGKLGDFGYTVGLTGYVYINGKNANAFETKLGLSYGDFSVNAQTLLKDVVWGNKGDTYWTLNYTTGLPYDITLNASLGYYSYKKEGKFLGTVDTLTGSACPAGQSFFDNGCFAGEAPIGGGFRHLIVGITQPIGQTGLTWGVQGLIGGDNRFGIKQKNKLLASLSYGF
ncbi:MAG: TorF family putative porin [Noviherbaspirillum sp.]